MIPEVSVVILCYKAGKAVYGFTDKTIKVLSDSLPSWEIILVGNYLENTNDETPKVVNDIASRKESVKALALPKEGMMGWDARSGMEQARGRYICLIDGDGQMLPEDIARVYERLKKDNLDLATTYRAVRHDNITRKIISYIYNLLFNLLFPGMHLKDINSKPKILTRDTYDKMRLTSNDWFFDAEMMIQARRLKLKIGEVPTEFYKCTYRKTFVKFNAVFEFIKNLFYARIKEFFK